MMIVSMQFNLCHLHEQHHLHELCNALHDLYNGVCLNACPNTTIASTSGGELVCIPGCPTGYYGQYCSPCQCQNGGTCNQGLTGTGACTCTGGFTGTTCNACQSGYYGSSCLGKVGCKMPVVDWRVFGLALTRDWGNSLSTMRLWPRQLQPDHHRGRQLYL